jgi:hypothetical protein
LSVFLSIAPYYFYNKLTLTALTISFSDISWLTACYKIDAMVPEEIGSNVYICVLGGVWLASLEESVFVKLSALQFKKIRNDDLPLITFATNGNCYFHFAAQFRE